MASFNLNPVNNNQQNGQQEEKWKADGFLNLYLPGADGNPKKLGAVALHKRKKADAQIIAALEGQNAEQIMQFILQNLSAQYQPADGSGAAGFALPE